MLLTLDLATVLGWTKGHVADTKFMSGYFRLPSTGQDIGKFAKAYDDWINEQITNVTSIVFESPVLPRKTQLATVRKLGGLCWHTEFVAAVVGGIKCYEANQSSIKLSIAGHGHASKDDMIAAIQGYGYTKVIEENEADAIAVRLYTIMTRHPEYAASFGLDLGLLGGRKVELTIPVPRRRPAQLLSPED